MNGICCCTVNGLPYEAPPTANKKEAKQLAAKCAVERILENAQVAGRYENSSLKFNFVTNMFKAITNDTELLAWMALSFQKSLNSHCIAKHKLLNFTTRLRLHFSRELLVITVQTPAYC